MDADAAKNVTYRQLKEAFVSGNNGTSAFEVDLLLTTAPLLLVLHGAFSVCTSALKGPARTVRGAAAATGVTSVSHLREQRWHLLLLELVVLPLPLTLFFTVAADELAVACLGMAVVNVVLLAAFAMSATSVRSPLRAAVAQLRSSLAARCTPASGERIATDYRGFMYLATAVCILAVDFSAFPRRFAKTEAFGKGLMDIGVGSFVFSGALVSRSPWERISGDAEHGISPKSSYVARASKTSLALVVLGVGRLVVTAGADYQSHVTEYGVHWNFFLTLAVVRLASAVLLSVSHRLRPDLCFVVIAAVHQLVLCWAATDFVMREGDRDRTDIVGLLVANREGLVSCAGYLAIHMAGAAVGRVLRSLGCLSAGGGWSAAAGHSRNEDAGSGNGDRKYRAVSHLRLFAWLSVGSGAAMLACAVCEHILEPTSRRTANLSYVLWMIHVNLFVISTMVLANVILCALSSYDSPAATAAAAADQLSERKRVPPSVADCSRQLLVAINRNGLFFFLVANVLTGLVNMTIDTMTVTSPVALLVLSSYILAVCLPVMALYKWNIRLL